VTGRERLLIIGGDAGGMSAAAQARRRAPADRLEIVAFEKGDYTSYGACGLPYYVAGEMDDPEELVSRTPDEHRSQGIDVRMRHEVIAVDLDARVLRVRDSDAGADRSEPFDQLVFANGAEPIRPRLPGVDAQGVHGIQTIGDGIALREHVVKEHVGDRAVVVGGGYIGLEMAEAMHERGMLVTVIDAGPQPMSTLDEDMGALVAAAIRKIGLELQTETRVQAFETDEDGHVRAVVTEHGTIPADIVVLGTGVRPNVRLARDAGVKIGPSGGVKTDPRMATSVPGVWAAGDCVETFHRISRRPVAIALGTYANKQGRVVGENATGGYATFGGVIGTAITKVCAYEIGRTGLNEEEARDAGFEFVTATIESTTRAHYFDGSPEITVKIVAEKRSGRLLGAQIVGREGAAKRIDVMAAAIWNEMTADEFVQLDLGYAPPFSPVWDPTLIAARKAAAMR
jgi:NADPH-dependent 2,4-dienoyl-CoA reductase/sulfur reductase-like enzyme